jgi:hypothetical protein
MAEVEFRWTAVQVHEPKGADWFWILGIFVVAFIVIGFLLSNFLFSLIALLVGGVVVLVVHQHPEPNTYVISLRGVEVNDRLYAFRDLHAFCIDRSDREQFFLRFRSNHILAPLSAIPIHEDVAIEIEKLLAAYVKEEHIDEPLAHRLFSLIGL